MQSAQSAPDSGPPSTVWERDWRLDVMRQMRESSEAHQQAAVILERINGRMDEHDRRITALEAAPREAQAAAITRRGLSTQELLAAVGVVTFLFAVISPHLSLGWR